MVNRWPLSGRSCITCRSGSATMTFCFKCMSTQAPRLKESSSLPIRTCTHRTMNSGLDYDAGGATLLVPSLTSCGSLPPPPAELEYFWRSGKLPDRPLVMKPAQAHCMASMRFTPSPRYIHAQPSSLCQSSSFDDVSQRPSTAEQDPRSWGERRYRSSARQLAGVWAQTLDAQVGAEADLSEVQKIAHMVLMNSEALQQRLTDTEEESALHRERCVLLEERSRALLAHNESLEKKCNELANENIDLRQELATALAMRAHPGQSALQSRATTAARMSGASRRCSQ